MRRTPLSDVMLQSALAGLIMLPLVLGFTGAGSFEEVYATTDPGAPTSRRALLFEALARSSWIGVGASVVALGIGIPVAWLLSRRKRSLMFLALCALPLALAPSVAVSGWLQWWSAWKEWTGAERPEIASAFRQMPAGGMTGMGPLFSIPAVAIILGLGLWPIVAYELWPAFVRARGEAYEAALLAGTPLRAFFRVALPMSRGELAAGALLVFLLAASDFTVSSLLLIRSLPIEVHDYLAQGKTACAAWAALPLVALTAFAAVVLARVHANKPEYISEHTGGLRAAHVAARGRWSGAVLVLGLILGFAVPLAGCFAGTLSGAGPWLRAFRTGVAPLTVSVRLAVAAAMVAVLLGALRITFWPGMRTRPLNGAALLLLVVPGSFLASGLLAFQLQSAETADAMGGAGQWLNQALPVGMLMACGYVLRFLYLPLRLADEGLRTLDPATLEAAELAGQSRFAQGLGVALPQLWGHLLAAGVLVFVLALGELPVSDKLAPPGAVPVSVWLFDEQHRGYTDAVFALSLLVGLAAAMGLLGAGGAASALRKFGPRRWEVLTGGKP